MSEEKNYIKQHIPDCCSDVDPYDGFFEDLSEVNFLNQTKLMPGFVRFSIARDKLYLMSEFSDGSYLVEGYLGKDIPELPDWSPLA